MERAGGVGVRLGHQLRAPGRHDLRHLVHLRRRRQAAGGWSSQLRQDGARASTRARSTRGTGPPFDAVPFDPAPAVAAHGAARRPSRSPTRHTDVRLHGQRRRADQGDHARRCSAPRADLRLGDAAATSRWRPTTRTCGGPRRPDRSRAGASTSRTRATRSSPPGSPTTRRQALWLVAQLDAETANIYRARSTRSPARRSTRCRSRRSAVRAARSRPKSAARFSTSPTAMPRRSPTTSTESSRSGA